MIDEHYRYIPHVVDMNVLCSTNITKWAHKKHIKTLFLKEENLLNSILRATHAMFREVKSTSKSCSPEKCQNAHFWQTWPHKFNYFYSLRLSEHA